MKTELTQEIIDSIIDISLVPTAPDTLEEAISEIEYYFPQLKLSRKQMEEIYNQWGEETGYFDEIANSKSHDYTFNKGFEIAKENIIILLNQEKNGPVAYKQALIRKIKELKA